MASRRVLAYLRQSLTHAATAARPLAAAGGLEVSPEQRRQRVVARLVELPGEQVTEVPPVDLRQPDEAVAVGTLAPASNCTTAPRETPSRPARPPG
jgi:hypothetical protein